MLLPGETCPKSCDHIDPANTSYGRKQPFTPVFLLFNDPTKSDKPIM